MNEVLNNGGTLVLNDVNNIFFLVYCNPLMKSWLKATMRSMTAMDVITYEYYHVPEDVSIFQL
jgi:hypothetical protein